MHQYPPEMPSYDQMFNAVLQALRVLGGSGRIDEINEKVYSLLNIPDAILNIPHGSDNNSQSEVEYRLHWSRSYLKAFGALENSSRGVWAIAPNFDTEHVNPKEVVAYVQKNRRSPNSTGDDNGKLDVPQETDRETIDDEEQWRTQLRDELLSLNPSAFERLAQRLLRESGFSVVEVTGKSGDGGIDGKGIINIGGLLSFHVLFQCKRFKEAVGANYIRDFRGAMQGRTDKGLIITTGMFTRDAIKEATRDGAPPIDLLDGEQLCNKLKELGLGVTVTTKVVETIEIDQAWFKELNG